MVERGGWIARGPENWTADGAVLRTPANDPDSAYRVVQGRRPGEGRLCAQGVTEWVLVDAATMRPHRIPADILPAFERR